MRFLRFKIVPSSIWDKPAHPNSTEMLCLLCAPCVLRAKNKRAVVGAAPSQRRPAFSSWTFKRQALTNHGPGLWKTPPIATGNSSKRSFCSAWCHQAFMCAHTHTHTDMFCLHVTLSCRGELRWCCSSGLKADSGGWKIIMVFGFFCWNVCQVRCFSVV